MEDVYFDERYGRLFERIENGVAEIFEFRHDAGVIRHLFIKREIPLNLQGRRYYDLVTPYGYGGPQILQCEEGRQAELVAAFEGAFQEYCSSNYVVSEFIRFHPLSGNAEDFRSCYDVAYLRETVGTNLKAYADPVEAEFSKSVRKNIRQALRAGVEYRTTLQPTDLSGFKSIYYQTMERNGADAFYYFADDYFNRLMELLGEHVLLIEVLFEGRVIGAAVNLVFNNLAHTHLSGHLSEFNRLAPASVLYYALALWGKAHGIDLIHGGGGRTNEADDSLLQFKKGFGAQSGFKFHAGRKIWNREVYQELCVRMNVPANTEYFPAYRSVPINEFNCV